MRSWRNSAGLALFCAACALTPSCHPLYSTPGATSPQEKPPANALSLAVGDSLDVTVPKLHDPEVPIALSGMTDAGYYLVTIDGTPSCVDATLRDSYALDAKVVPFISGRDAEHTYLVVEQPPSPPVWLLLFPGAPADQQVTVTVSVGFLYGPVQGSHSPSDQPGALATDGSETSGVFAEFATDSCVFFTAADLTAGQLYRVTAVTKNDTGFVSLAHTEIDATPSQKDATFRTFSRMSAATSVTYFSSAAGISPFAAKIVLVGTFASSYTVSLAPETKQILPDAFEDDGGPISATLDAITDNGTDASFSSGQHTLITADQDWLRFSPVAGTTYHIGFRLDDAVGAIDAAITPIASLQAVLVGPNGASPESQAESISFYAIGESSLDKEHYLSWTAPNPAGAEYFIRVISDGLPLSYTVLVDAIRP